MSDKQVANFILFFFLLTGLPVSISGAADFQICQECHMDSMDMESKLTYTHSPFVNKECEICHLAEAPVTTPTEPGDKKSPAKRNHRQRINWLAESHSRDISHWFLLPGDKVSNNDLIVDVYEPDGKIIRRNFTVPLLNDLEEAGDSGAAPVISDVKVLKVEHGILLSATIGWQTDSIAEALVHYGTGDLTQTSDHIERFGKNHEVILSKLEPDTTYNFAVVSQDIFGRSKVSETLTFSTSEPFTAENNNDMGNPPGNEKDAGITGLFQRFNADYLFEVTLLRPASVIIGTQATAAGRASNEEICRKWKNFSRSRRIADNSKKMAEEREAHAGLSSIAVISKGACRECHRKRCTHPVNVCPDPEMSISEEYPLLQNGWITCISCHLTHSSPYEHFTRRYYKYELCIGCHTDKKQKRSNRL